jgi:hypothetical protein
MARYTLERINQKIALWEAADDAVSTGQEYSIAGKRLTRVDAGFIEEKLDRLYAQRDQLERGGGRVVVRTMRVAR